MDAIDEKMPNGPVVTDAYPLPPEGVSLEEQDGLLVMRYKETAVTGMIFLVLAGQFFLTILIYSFAVGGVPFSEIAGAGVIFTILFYVGVAKYINVTTLTVNDSEVVVSRGPVRLSSKKHFPIDQIVGFRIKVHVGKSRSSFSVVTTLTQARKPKRIIYCNRNLEIADFYKIVLSRRLGLPEDLPRIRA
ncbi:MAG: hypothetical protein GY854_18355 [Deltaproteobacteria bacterium]|nr:hypothetical protein [Deltaproteobacteria bacterium]